MDKKSNTMKLTLCGSKKVPECPTVTIGPKKVVITDDHGGKVLMTRTQFELLLTVKDQLKKK